MHFIRHVRNPHPFDPASPLVYHMQENGWTKISADNVRDLHYAYKAEREATMEA